MVFARKQAGLNVKDKPARQQGKSLVHTSGIGRHGDDELSKRVRQQCLSLVGNKVLLGLLRFLLGGVLCRRANDILTV